MYDMRDSLSYHFSGVTAKENYGWGTEGAEDDIESDFTEHH